MADQKQRRINKSEQAKLLGELVRINGSDDLDYLLAPSYNVDPTSIELDDIYMSSIRGVNNPTPKYCFRWVCECRHIPLKISCQKKHTEYTEIGTVLRKKIIQDAYIQDVQRKGRETAVFLVYSHMRYMCNKGCQIQYCDYRDYHPWPPQLDPLAQEQDKLDISEKTRFTKRAYEQLLKEFMEFPVGEVQRRYFVYDFNCADYLKDVERKYADKNAMIDCPETLYIYKAFLSPKCKPVLVFVDEQGYVKEMMLYTDDSKSKIARNFQNRFRTGKVQRVITEPDNLLIRRLKKIESLQNAKFVVSPLTLVNSLLRLEKEMEYIAPQLVEDYSEFTKELISRIEELYNTRANLGLSITRAEKLDLVKALQEALDEWSDECGPFTATGSRDPSWSVETHGIFKNLKDITDWLTQNEQAVIEAFSLEMEFRLIPQLPEQIARFVNYMNMDSCFFAGDSSVKNELRLSFSVLRCKYVLWSNAERSEYYYRARAIRLLDMYKTAPAICEHSVYGMMYASSLKDSMANTEYVDIRQKIHDYFICPNAKDQLNVFNFWQVLPHCDLNLLKNAIQYKASLVQVSGHNVDPNNIENLYQAISDSKHNKASDGPDAEFIARTEVLNCAPHHFTPSEWQEQFNNTVRILRDDKEIVPETDAVVIVMEGGFIHWELNLEYEEYRQKYSIPNSREKQIQRAVQTYFKPVYEYLQRLLTQYKYQICYSLSIHDYINKEETLFVHRSESTVEDSPITLYYCEKDVINIFEKYYSGLQHTISISCDEKTRGLFPNSKYLDIYIDFNDCWDLFNDVLSEYEHDQVSSEKEIARNICALLMSIYISEPIKGTGSPEERLTLRQKESLPIINEFFDTVKMSFSRKEIKNDSLKKALQYALEHEPNFRRFLTDGLLQFVFSRNEQKRFHDSQANFHICQLVLNDEARVIVQTLIDTAVANEAKPDLYIRYLIEKMPLYLYNNRFDEYMPELMPWSDTYKRYQTINNTK